MSVFKPFGPIAPRIAMPDAIRSAVGAALALLVLALVFGLEVLHLPIIAPIGATAVLIFAAPNSPLSQPWSVVVGNVVAALIGVTCALLVPHVAVSGALAVGLTIVVLARLHALHPPAGAVALLAGMAPAGVGELGYGFVLAPVAVGSIAIVVLGMVYARLTGRRYPFRQFNEPSAHKTEDRNPVSRLGLSEEDLIRILERHRQSFNMGVEDLARVIGAAQMTAAAHAGGTVLARDVMSRGLVTVTPQTGLVEVAHVFERHKFTSLPVTDAEGAYLGLIYQYHVIAGLAQHAQGHAGSPLVAADLMRENLPVAGPLTPMGALVAMVAAGDIDGVPVIEGGKLVGIVTRTDLLAALARQKLHDSAAG